MSKYAFDFKIALSLYTTQNKRPGYVTGWFSWLRHDYKLYPHIQDLQTNLDTSEDDIQASHFLRDYFESPKTTFNNHSFSLYLLDRLVKKYPHEHWEQYYPKEKRIAFYTGTLYRGTLQHPSDAFKNGMTSGVSEKIEDYANDTNMHTGVSTSKSYDVANIYKITTIPTHRGVYYQVGYLYEINYRGKGGIDIIETLKLRGHDFTAALASHKDEVNIVGKILPEDIVGYWDNEGILHKNPHYVPDRELETSESLPQRMDELFNSEQLRCI